MAKEQNVLREMLSKDNTFVEDFNKLQQEQNQSIRKITEDLRKISFLF